MEEGCGSSVSGGWRPSALAFGLREHDGHGEGVWLSETDCRDCPEDGCCTRGGGGVGSAEGIGAAAAVAAGLAAAVVR